jgi:signal transduction histidine kinase
VHDALDALGPERRLSGAQVQLDIPDGAYRVHADPDWLRPALAGALGSMLTLVQDARSPALQIRLDTDAPGTCAILSIAQHAVVVPAATVSRFFDAEYTDRPGGYQAAIELAAARRVTELHRGTINVVSVDRGGCRLLLTLPAAAR